MCIRRRYVPFDLFNGGSFSNERRVKLSLRAGNGTPLLVLSSTGLAESGTGAM